MQFTLRPKKHNFVPRNRKFFALFALSSTIFFYFIGKVEHGEENNTVRKEFEEFSQSSSPAIPPLRLVPLSDIQSTSIITGVPNFRCFDVSADAFADRRTFMADLNKRVCHGVPEPKEVPVVFMHLEGAKGKVDESYLQINIRAALDLGNKVTVLADVGESFALDPRVEVVPINLTDSTSPLTSRAISFAEYYVHLSTNGFSFELVSFQRFFILQAWLTTTNYTKIVYIDSDVMLFVNAADEMQCYSHCDAVLSSPNPVKHAAVSAHTSILTAHFLEAFTEFVEDMYANQTNLNVLQNTFTGMQNNNQAGGICDMTILGRFYRATEDKNNELSRFKICNSAADIGVRGMFDHKCAYRWIPSFGQDENFGNPYFMINDSKIPLKSIHFQGACKLDEIACWHQNAHSGT